MKNRKFRFVGTLLFCGFCTIATINFCRAEETKCLIGQIMDPFHGETLGDKCYCPDGTTIVYEGRAVACDVQGFDCRGKECNNTPNPE